MNGHASKKALRQELVAIIEAQKGVIGALARGLTEAKADIETLKQKAADNEIFAEQFMRRFVDLSEETFKNTLACRVVAGPGA